MLYLVSIDLNWLGINIHKNNVWNGKINTYYVNHKIYERAKIYAATSANSRADRFPASVFFSPLKNRFHVQIRGIRLPRGMKLFLI